MRIRRLLILFFLIFLIPANVQATNLNEQENAMDRILEDYGFSMKEFTNEAVQGNVDLRQEGILKQVTKKLSHQIEENKGDLLKILLLGLVAGVFANFTSSFGTTGVSEMGFYAVYLLLFCAVTTGYMDAFTLASDTMTNLLDFMKALVPAMAISLSATTGSATATAFYECNFMGLTLIETFFLKVIMPITQVYFFLRLANHLIKNGKFSKMAELLDTFIRWSVRSILGVLIGLQGIQMLIYPVVDQWKRKTIWKTAASLPGVGGMFGSVSETVLGTGIIIKNALGVGGLLAIIFLCMVPFVQLIAFTLSFRLGTALLQPVTEPRVVQVLQATSDSGKLLLTMLASSMFLFLISVAIVLQATSRVG